MSKAQGKFDFSVHQPFNIIFEFIYFICAQTGSSLSCKTNIRKRGETFLRNKQVFVNKIKKSTLKFNNTSMKAYCVCLNESYIHLYFCKAMWQSFASGFSVLPFCITMFATHIRTEGHPNLLLCISSDQKWWNIYLTNKKGSLLIHTIRIM